MAGLLTSSSIHVLNQEHRDYLEAVWSVAMAQLNNGSTEIVLDASVRGLVGDIGIQTIAGRFAMQLSAYPSVLDDPQHNVIRMLPPPSVAVEMTIPKQNPVTKKANKRPSKVPRPPNAFILYRKDKHEMVKDENPTLMNASISIIIGRMWKTEREDVKKHYKDLADKIKAAHMEAHPNYQYHPRRPDHIQRRLNARTHYAARAIREPTSNESLVPQFQQVWDDTNYGDVLTMDFQPGTAGLVKELAGHFNEANDYLWNSHGEGATSLANSTSAAFAQDNRTADFGPLEAMNMMGQFDCSFADATGSDLPSLPA